MERDSTPTGASRRLLSPFCAKLWSKKKHFLTTPPQTERDILDGSNACWCNQTKLAVGPDRDVVAPDRCREDRACFVPYGR
jgi:hypothetical protein